MVCFVFGIFSTVFVVVDVAYEREREERTFALCAPAVINQPKCSTFEFCSPTKKGTILCGSAADDRIVRNCL